MGWSGVCWISARLKHCHMCWVLKVYFSSRGNVPCLYSAQTTQIHTLCLSNLGWLQKNSWRLQFAPWPKPGTGLRSPISVCEQIYREEGLLGGISTCVWLLMCNAFCSCQHWASIDYERIEAHLNSSSFFCTAFSVWVWGAGYSLYPLLHCRVHSTSQLISCSLMSTTI